jgi:hypothetical protein
MIRPTVYTMVEIAATLPDDVSHNTVKQWRNRGLLPDPTWILATGPAWTDEDIEPWIAAARRAMAGGRSEGLYDRLREVRAGRGDVRDLSRDPAAQRTGGGTGRVGLRGRGAVHRGGEMMDELEFLMVGGRDGFTGIWQVWRGTSMLGTVQRHLDPPYQRRPWGWRRSIGRTRQCSAGYRTRREAAEGLAAEIGRDSVRSSLDASP